MSPAVEQKILSGDFSLGQDSLLFFSEQGQAEPGHDPVSVHKLYSAPLRQGRRQNSEAFHAGKQQQHPVFIILAEGRVFPQTEVCRDRLYPSGKMQ